MRKNNVILIGMPGAGKSTVGILLSKEIGLDFIDTDVAIQVREGQTLQTILDERGYIKLRDIEQEVILGLALENTVIATGGSAVYGAQAMRYLGEQGVIVFIDVVIEQLMRRVNNIDGRGVARKPGQGFEDLFLERRVLYEQYADIRIPVDDESAEQVLAMILMALEKHSKN
jgi:shikimate kinase